MSFFHNPSLVSKDGIAARYGVRPSTVLAWFRRGLIPGLRIGKLVRFDMSAVDAALRGRGGAR